MKIESQIQDIAKEIQVKEFQGSAVERQRSATSGSKSDSTREPIISNDRVSKEQAQIIKTIAPDPIDVRKAVEKLNKIAEAQKKDVSFSVDEKSDSTVIKVFRRKTGELIKQFPPEEILAMRARIRSVTGLLFDSKV